MMGKTRRIAALARGGATVLLLTIGAALAQAQGLDDVHEFHIEAQPLDAALIEFSEQADLQLMVQTELVAGQRSAGVSGALTAGDALLALLNDTDLAFQAVGDDTVAVSQADAGGDSDSGNRLAAGATPIVMAQNRTRLQQSQGSQENEKETERERPPIEEIVITGTNIRGIAPESSPVRTFTREDIQISGAGTAQDFIQTLTTNFGGGSNASRSLPNDINSTLNLSFGSSVNLRGLGSGSTLVLLNGHRVAPASGIGDFVDISMIPATVIERVEVLADGASSIYGGDAVAGVTNFILRDDFDGIETSLRYGTTTQGPLDEYRTSIVAGENWRTGNALVVYEFYDKDNLSAGDRAFAEATGLPDDLLPSQKRHSALMSLSQELTPGLDTFSDFNYSKRESARDTTDISGNSFRDDISSESLNISAGGSWKVSHSQFLDFSGTYSAIDTNAARSGASTTVTAVDSEMWTADAKISGTLLRIPGGDLKLAFGGHYRQESFSNVRTDLDRVDRNANRNVYALFGEVLIPLVEPDNPIPGVKRFELNVAGRFADYSDFGSTANPKIGALWSPFDGLNLRGSYSTSFNPPPIGRVGALDRFANAARTSFWNSLFGFTPADLSIEDVVVLTVLGTGRDLEAETSKAFTTGFDCSFTSDKSAISLSATYFDIEFDGRLGSTPIPDNRNFLDAPNIAFNSPDAFPEGTIIFSPTQQQIDSILSSVDRPVVSVAGADPLEAQIIAQTQIVRNLARSEVRGIDIDILYTDNLDIGDVSLGLNGTYIQDFQQQGSIATPLVEQVDTLYNPIDLKLRGYVGFANNGFAANMFINYADDYHVDNTVGTSPIDSWTTVDLSVIYDTGMRLENSIFNNVTLRLSVLNITNVDPPMVPSNPGFGIGAFDPSNATPLGRFLAFEITKRL